MDWFHGLLIFFILIASILARGFYVTHRNNNAWMGLPYELVAAVLVVAAIAGTIGYLIAKYWI